VFGPGFAGELVGFPARVLGRYSDRGIVSLSGLVLMAGERDGQGRGHKPLELARPPLEPTTRLVLSTLEISCSTDKSELLGRSDHHRIRVFAEKQLVVCN
jgi:hypothetical protein